MERRVKERLVGAAILVAIVVLVVPELLSGANRLTPGGTVGGGSMRTVTVNLASHEPGSRPSSAPLVRQQPPVRAASAPSVIASAAPTPMPTPTPTPTPIPAPTRPPQRVPQRLEKPHSSPISIPSHARWTIQLGSFEDRANALRLARLWKARGYAAYISSVGHGAHSMHRVRVGSFPDRAAALSTARKFEAHGQRASLVPPGH